MLPDHRIEFRMWERFIVRPPKIDSRCEAKNARLRWDSYDGTA